MNRTEPVARIPSPRAGLPARLGALLTSTRGGAPSMRIALRASALALATAGLLALTVTPALANQARLFSGSFGAGSSTTPNPYPLSTEVHESANTGIGVDSSTGPSAHDIYVADPPNHRVEKFDPEGNFLLMFGKEVNKTKVEEAGSTEAEQNLCTLASGDQCQAGGTGTAPGAFKGHIQLLLAVDSSKGPSAGDVYVADPGDNLVSKFDSSGHLIGSWGNNGPLESPNGQLNGAPGKPFGQLGGLAVDSSGDLWANDRQGLGSMSEFRQDGTLITEWGSPKNENGNVILQVGGAFAIDSEGDLLFGAGHVVSKLTPDGTPIGLFREEGNATIEGLALDSSTDALYLDWQTFGSPEGAIRRYDPGCPYVLQPPFENCPPLESFGSNRLSYAGAIAIDPSSPAATLYAVESSGQVLAFDRATVPDATTHKASGFTATAATLNGAVNPSGVELKAGLEGCRFEWGETAEPYEHTAPCDKTAAQIGVGSGPVEVHAAISGLQAGHTYHFRLVAANASQVNELIDEPSLGADLAFGPPLIESSSAAAVTATSATLQAEVDPQNVATSYRFEYLTEAAYQANGESFAGPEPPISVPQPDASLGDGEIAAAASQHLQGLQPHTTYRYRILATNALGAGEGQALAFTTQTPAPFALPDNRAWELVSPPDKHGAALASIQGGAAVQAAASGAAMTYLATSPTEAQPQGFGSGEQLLSARGPGGWSSRDIGPSHDKGAIGIGITNGQEYALFSPDLSLGVLEPFGGFEPALSPQATEQTPYLRTNFAAAGFCDSSCYQPILSACPPEGEPCPPDVEEAADVPPGTQFSTAGKCAPNSPLTCAPPFLGASPDLSHVVLSSPAVALTPTGGWLYEWSATAPPAERLQSISVLPAGEGGAAVGGVLGGGGIGKVGSRRASAVSEDGSRVVWLYNLGSQNSRLYLRDTAKGETVRLDTLQPGASGTGAPEPRFQFASADGSRVFFTDSQALTADSGAEGSAGEAKRDLYECEIVENSSGELQCELTDLTPLSGGEHAAVQGLTPGGAEDGSYAYFVANGALAPGAEPGQANLYVSHGGTTKLIAVLSANDFPDWAGGGLASISTLSARVSPDGRWLAFMSQRPLTGYDNRDAVTGERDEEVFLYDAAANGGEGNLLCPSCDPTGARPLGSKLSSAAGVDELGFLGTQHAWPEKDVRFAALLPGWTLPTYQSRYLSDSGRLFFESKDALVPQDSNGTWDVYQYEPLQGAGSPQSDDCSAASTTYSHAAEGCIALISSGTSAEPSAFLDASESGDDVFFLTASRLSRRDEDTSYDVYDARVGGGEAETIKPVECSGDACQQPATPPDHPTPGTLTVNGPENASPARKGHKHNRKHKPKHKRPHRNRVNRSRGADR